MHTRRRLAGSLPTAVLAGALVLVMSGCDAGDAARDGPGPSVSDPESLVTRAEAFRALSAEGRWEEARAMMSEDPRRWFEAREGEGAPWRAGVPGPWAGWDEHFGSAAEVVEWREDDRSATAVVRETNDYFRLLERPPVTNELTYFFTGDGRIEGLLIRGVGERPSGRTEEFLAWARANEPGELAELMPGGEIDPAGDHPQRFRALLDRWREATGRDPIPRRPRPRARSGTRG